jgi:hypothetical protein
VVVPDHVAIIVTCEMNYYRKFLIFW